MGTAEQLTFDIVPPRRPSLVDVGNNTMVNDAINPPNPATMPHAEQLNQWAMQIARFGGILPVAIFSVRFSGGTPVLDSFVALPTVPVTSTFTITDFGDGDTKISWPADTFPASVVMPMATINGTHAGSITAQYSTNAVQVLTFDAGGSSADYPFTVAVY